MEAPLYSSPQSASIISESSYSDKEEVEESIPDEPEVCNCAASYARCFNM